jgi:Helicase HerA, central domain
MPIFNPNEVVGSFAGFAESGLEFHADIVVPYQPELQNLPLHGAFVLVQLANDNEALLGRITMVQAQGRLTSSIGEDFAVRQVLDERPIPDDLRRRFLKYRIDIRILGVLRERNGELAFVASHRRVPHVGAKVAFLSDRILTYTVDAEASGEQGEEEIGFFTLGEFVHAGSDTRLAREDWMTVLSPALVVRFPTGNLVSKRSVVFARAGFGKSNLMKLLFAATYREQPTVAYARGEVPVGTVIFDPEGEYFFPDNQGRPGLCDVPHLRDKLVVFTDRVPPAGGYAEFVAGGTKLDIRSIPPSLIFRLIYPREASQANQERLSRLSQSEWSDCIDAYDSHGYSGLLKHIEKVKMFPEDRSRQQLPAAIRKIEHIVHRLHDPSSRTLEYVQTALADGKLCVVDISQMRGKSGFDLAGLILSRIFEFNQDQYTQDSSRAYPVIAVIEEAQSVLVSDPGDDNPFVEWAKEGRKYGLGSILITQQPGSIPEELVSQADNYFVFHLLSESDLKTLRAANAHFSEDLLSSLLNEPIPGNGIVWSSAAQRPYPISTRILDFGETYDHKLPKHTDHHRPPPYVSSLRGQGITSATDRRKAIDAEIDIVIEQRFSENLKLGRPGVKLGTLAKTIKTYTQKLDPDASDSEIFRAAMNEGKRAVKRLTPSGMVCKEEKIDTGDGAKVHLWWEPEP